MSILAIDYGAKKVGLAKSDEAKRIALLSALSVKAKLKEIAVIDSINLEAPKTKAFVNLFQKLKIEKKKPLMVLVKENRNVYLSARNIPGANVRKLNELIYFFLERCPWF